MHEPHVRTDLGLWIPEKHAREAEREDADLGRQVEALVGLYTAERADMSALTGQFFSVIGVGVAYLAILAAYLSDNDLPQPWLYPLLPLPVVIAVCGATGLNAISQSRTAAAELAEKALLQTARLERLELRLGLRGVRALDDLTKLHEKRALSWQHIVTLGGLHTVAACSLLAGVAGLVAFCLIESPAAGWVLLGFVAGYAIPGVLVFWFAALSIPRLNALRRNDRTSDDWYLQAPNVN